jgi:UDP-3-O-[3-hydroxymyristoyl] glucosamine N-acyltransferase
MTREYTLAQVASHIGAELMGDAAHIIRGIAPLDSAGNDTISFLDNPKYRKLLPDTQAAAVILTRENAADCPVSHLVVPDPYYSYAKVAELFIRESSFPAGIHPTAVIDPSSQIDPSAHIGPYVVIGAETSIGAKVIIGAQCSIGERCRIGEGTRLWPQVSIYSDVTIGQRARIHSGAVIGADGFGLAKHQGRWHDIPQLGGVTLGDDVLVGANTTIDCGALKDTQLHDGVKLDNQVQIGHNVQIGAHTAIAGCVGIAGSTQIGANCIIGGASSIAGHIKISDNVTLMGTAAVSRSLLQPGTYASGFRVQPMLDWGKIVSHVENISTTMKRIKKLEELIGTAPIVMENK